LFLIVESSCAMHLTSSRKGLPAQLRGLELPATNECRQALYPCQNKSNKALVVQRCIQFTAVAASSQASLSKLCLGYQRDGALVLFQVLEQWRVMWCFARSGSRQICRLLHMLRLLCFEICESVAIEAAAPAACLRSILR
jgi:hypothetical protein